MVRSLAVLCLQCAGTLRFEAVPDRRQSPDRRHSPRGGRRKGDVATTDRFHADFNQPTVHRPLARA